jgi:hypothetical protein
MHRLEPLLIHVGVNLGGGHIGVPHEFLHRPDIVTALEQVRGKTVPERVAGSPSIDPGPQHCLLHLPLHRVLVDVVPAPDPRARIHAQTRRREHVLPQPLERRAGILLPTASGSSTPP